MITFASENSLPHTYNALNTFITNNHINTKDLNSYIILYIQNDSDLQYNIAHHRYTPASVVYSALQDVVNDMLTDEYSRKYKCTISQLEQWLLTYGEGEESLRESIEYVEILMKECQP
jgi:hypothetical protein